MVRSSTDAGGARQTLIVCTLSGTTPSSVRGRGEEAELELKTRTATFAHVDAEWRASQGELAAELTQLEQELAEKTAEQAGARAKLGAPDLAQYDQLRRRKGGIAVVEMEGSVCGACGVRVAAHVVQQLSQSDHLARCSNCERMLVRV